MKHVLAAGLVGLFSLMFLSDLQAAEQSNGLETTPLVWMSQESDNPKQARMFYARLFYWPSLRPQQPVTATSASDYARKGLSRHQKTTLLDPWEPTFRASFYHQDDAGKGQSTWVPWLQNDDITLLEASLRKAGFWKLSSPQDRSWLWQQEGDKLVAISKDLPALRGFYGTKGPVPRGAFLRASGRDLLSSTWVPPLRVSNLEGTIKRAQRLGGSLVSQDTNRAVLKDPTGALFALQVQQARR